MTKEKTVGDAIEWEFNVIEDDIQAELVADMIHDSLKQALGDEQLNKKLEIK